MNFPSLVTAKVHYHSFWPLRERRCSKTNVELLSPAAHRRISLQPIHESAARFDITAFVPFLPHSQPVHIHVVCERTRNSWEVCTDIFQQQTILPNTDWHFPLKRTKDSITNNWKARSKPPKDVGNAKPTSLRAFLPTFESFTCFPPQNWNGCNNWTICFMLAAVKSFQSSPQVPLGVFFNTPLFRFLFLILVFMADYNRGSIIISN